MESEYENIKIKEQRTYLVIAGVVILVLVGVLFGGDYNFSSLSFVINLFLLGFIVYLLTKRQKEDTIELEVDIQKAIREYSGDYIDMRDSTHTSIGDMVYYYFPYEYIGIEYDKRKRLITSKLKFTLIQWIEYRTKIDLLAKITEEQVLQKKKDELKEEAGYERKNE